MRLRLTALAASIWLAATAGAAVAAPAVEFQEAVARVVVVPENRQDLQVDVVRANPRLPLRVWRFAGRTYVSGRLGQRIGACRRGAAPGVAVAGLGDMPYAAMPQVVVRTPMHVRVYVAGAVWGAVGRSDALEFSNAGCGDWLIANVRRRMRLSLAGSGGARTGRAGAAELYNAGDGAISTGSVAGGVIAINAGAGAIEMAEAGGSFVAKVAGPGSIRATAGAVTDMEATVAGAGSVILNGVARTLKASIIGSGDVKVLRVTGGVVKTVIGRGSVRIGS